MGQRFDFWSKIFFFKNGFLLLFLIKINKIYSTKEMLCQNIQNTLDNLKNTIFFFIFQIISNSFIKNQLIWQKLFKFNQKQR
jgi:hypothetical protein